MSEITKSEDVAAPAAAEVPWWQRLWLHAAVLALVLLAMVPFFDSDAPAFTDEGIYSAQVDNLAEGSWSSPRPAVDVDVDGTYVALNGALVEGDRAIPYVRKPLYPLTLLPFYELGGTAGLLVASAMGTFVAALCAALLARRIRPSYAVPTLWLVGVGSPLLFDAYLVMGHSIAAGLAGVLALSVAHAVDSRRAGWFAVVVPTTVALVLIRSEGTLVIAALAVVLAATAVRQLRPVRLDAWRLAGASAVGAVGLASYVLDGRLARALSDGLQTRTGSVVTDRDPLNAVWTGLVRPWGLDGRTAVATTVIAALCTVLAIVVLRVAPRMSVLAVALLVLGAGSSLVRHLEPAYLVTGLLGVFPVVAAVILLHKDDFRDPLVTRLAATCALTAAAIVATVYEVGASTEWGGRFFHVLLPLAGPLIVLGLDRGRQLLPRTEAIVAGCAVLVLLLSTSAMAVRTNLRYRYFSSQLVEQSIAFAAQRDEPLIVFAPVGASGSGRLFWKRYTDDEDQLSLSSMGQLGQMLHRAADADRTDVVLVTTLAPQTLDLLLAENDRDGWEIDDVVRAGGNGYLAIGLSRSG